MTIRGRIEKPAKFLINISTINLFKIQRAFLQSGKDEKKKTFKKRRGKGEKMMSLNFFAYLLFLLVHAIWSVKSHVPTQLTCYTDPVHHGLWYAICANGRFRYSSQLL